MELTELRATWQRMEEALERGNRMRAETLLLQKLDRTQQSLKPLRRIQVFQILFGVFFIILAASLWVTKPTAISLILCGVLVQLYGIGCILTAGLVLSSLNRIDYAGPVANVQAGLAEVKKTYGVSVLIAGLSWWFLWIPVLMLLLGLVGINLYAHAPSVIWIGVAIGMIGLFGMYGIYQYSLRSRNVRLQQGLERVAFGKGLTDAHKQIAEIRTFEEEASGMTS